MDRSTRGQDQVCEAGITHTGSSFPLNELFLARTAQVISVTEGVAGVYSAHCSWLVPRRRIIFATLGQGVGGYG